MVDTETYRNSISRVAVIKSFLCIVSDAWDKSERCGHVLLFAVWCPYNLFYCTECLFFDTHGGGSEMIPLHQADFGSRLLNLL